MVNNGTVAIAGGTLTQNSNISGNGTVQIGKGATLALNGTATADTIAFLDTGATLLIGSASSFNGSTSGVTPYSVDATLTGFQAGDSLVLGAPVTTAVYAAGLGGSPGTLTLSNGATTIETLHLTGNFAGEIFFVSPTTNNGASVSLIEGLVGNPVVSSPTLTVAENAASTALGIAVPTDPNYAAGQLAITATSLPNDGTVTLADGTAVAAGQALTSNQLTGLRFKPTPGLFNTSSTFTYTVSDPSNNASTGTATLAIGPAVGNPVLSSPTLTVAENAASTALGIAVPTDPNYAAGQLAITATSLPGDGTLTLADGTVLTAGQALTSDQLTGLRFKPTPGLFSTTSAFTYTVSDPAGNASIAAVTLAIGPAVGNPVVSSPTLTMAENAASTALGIVAPTDPNYAAGQLSITVTGLPNDGAVTLADGTTAVTAGQALTSGQLTGLRFKPTPGLFNARSAFTYTASDPANNTSTGIAILAIGPALGNPAVSSPTLTVAENAASTALGIAAPTDPNYAAGQLTTIVTGLPNDGTVTLADGITAVIAGQALSSAQLTGLRFKPTPGLFNASSAFSYTVSDPADNTALGAATLAIGPAVGNPVVSSLTLTVVENVAALGITAPTDPNYAAGQLSITATGLPNDGTVTLADGATAVAAGQALSSAQLTGLRFKPTPGLFNARSAFTYTVSDPAGNASTGAATLAIGLPPTPKAEFDAAYYLQHNPDVAAAKLDPLKHFEQYGWKEGRNPDALFNVRYYLNQNPDVAAAKVNPLTHYKTSGWKEGRDPSVNFSTAAYLKANPDIAKAQIDPLKHYIEYGSREGRMLFAARPHGVGAQDLLVDNAYYFSKYSDVSVSGANPFTHYDTVGWRQGRNPDALFDTNYYLQRNPDVKAAAVDPMLHYERYGWKEGRDPSAQFSTSRYLAANADVKAAGVNPLVHYEQNGIREGRPIFHV